MENKFGFPRRLGRTEADPSGRDDMSATPSGRLPDYLQEKKIFPNARLPLFLLF
jgi:hypothetical protein